MASELPMEQQTSYSAIIDDILANADLTTISAKAIRKGLQEKVDYDLTAQKQAITDLIMVRFDKVQREREARGAPIPEPAPTANGNVDHAPASPKPPKAEQLSASASPTKRKAADSDDLSDVADTTPPPKKTKKSKFTEETDEQMAMRIAAELNAPSARSTRGGGSAKKKAPAKKPSKQPKKKSKAKINSDDDSDVDADMSSSTPKPEKERKGGFHKPMILSEPLAQLLGEPQLSRPQTVKRIWAYVKERDLQEPTDKRQIRCDDKLRAVFKQDRVHMFTMNKILAGQLYAVDE